MTTVDVPNPEESERTPQQKLQGRLNELERWLRAIIQENEHIEGDLPLADISNVPIKTSFNRVAQQLVRPIPTLQQYGVIEGRRFINSMIELIGAMRRTAEDPQNTDLTMRILKSDDFLTLLGHIDINFSPSAQLDFHRVEVVGGMINGRVNETTSN